MLCRNSQNIQNIAVVTVNNSTVYELNEALNSSEFLKGHFAAWKATRTCNSIVGMYKDVHSKRVGMDRGIGVDNVIFITLIVFIGSEAHRGNIVGIGRSVPVASVIGMGRGVCISSTLL
jgi:hypothetical protein